MGGGFSAGGEGGAGGTAESPEALLTRLEKAWAGGQRVHSREDGLALHAVALLAARGTGPLELSLGEGLDSLARRGLLLKLGRSGVGDVGREDLGLPDGYARRLRRNAAKLRFRPVLRAAIAAGEVTSRKAEVLLDRTASRDDAFWTARAKADTVRGLEAATRAGAGEDGEDFHSVLLSLPASQQDIVWTALDWARLLEGGATRRLRQVEVILMEYLGGFPSPMLQEWPWPGEVAAPPAQEEAPVEVGVAEARPEDEWPFDAQATLARLKALVQERAATDERLRRACLLVKELGAHRWVGFTSYALWCSEALGLSPRTVRQLVALERRLQALPPLREAVRDGTLTLVQAHQVARHATAADVGRRIAEAAGRPALDTQRQGDVVDERRMRDAGVLKLAFSGRVHRLWLDALVSAQLRGHGSSPGEALMCMSAHFILTWRQEVKRGLRQAGPAMRRDDWRCQVPGCSRGAEHLHHITWRCRGGNNNQKNLVGLCARHHQQGVHQGHLVISGEAPEAVVFELGEEELVRSRLEPPGRAVA